MNKLSLSSNSLDIKGLCEFPPAGSFGEFGVLGRAFSGGGSSPGGLGQPLCPRATVTAAVGGEGWANALMLSGVDSDPTYELEAKSPSLSDVAVISTPSSDDPLMSAVPCGWVRAWTARRASIWTCV